MASSSEGRRSSRLLNKTPDIANTTDEDFDADLEAFELEEDWQIDFDDEVAETEVIYLNISQSFFGLCQGQYPKCLFRETLKRTALYVSRFLVYKFTYYVWFMLF